MKKIVLLFLLVTLATPVFAEYETNAQGKIIISEEEFEGITITKTVLVQDLQNDGSSVKPEVDVRLSFTCDGDDYDLKVEDIDNTYIGADFVQFMSDCNAYGPIQGVGTFVDEHLE